MRPDNIRPIKWITLMALLLYFVNIVGMASALDITKLQWDNGTSGTLKRNEEISFNGYSVKVIAFNTPVESDRYKEIPKEAVIPFVGLNISNNNSFSETINLGQGESFISSDGEFKVVVKELPSGSAKVWTYENYGPWVIVELSSRAKPELELRIDADDEFVSGLNTEIKINAVLKNTGSADLTDVYMDIKTEIPILRGNLQQYYESIKKGVEVNKTITFSTPMVAELKKYEINVNTSGFDIKGDAYTSNQTKTILIAPQSQKAPFLKKTTIAKMYLKDQMLVTLYLKNNANYQLNNVRITDSIPEGFRQLNNNSLNWVVNISANGEWNFRYLLKPTEANKGVLFPPMKAELNIKNEYYMIQSNRPETTVYGPKIDVSKYTDISEISMGDEVTVTVMAVNSGSTPTMVTVQDNLPSDAVLIDGNTAGEEYLEVNKELNFSYTFRSNSDGPIVLPPPEAHYFELGSSGERITSMGDEIILESKPEPTPEPTPEPVIEIPDNSTEQNNTSEYFEPSVDSIQPEEQPVIVQLLLRVIPILI